MTTVEAVAVVNSSNVATTSSSAPTGEVIAAADSSDIMTPSTTSRRRHMTTSTPVDSDPVTSTHVETSDQDESTQGRSQQVPRRARGYWLMRAERDIERARSSRREPLPGSSDLDLVASQDRNVLSSGDVSMHSVPVHSVGNDNQDEVLSAQNLGVAESADTEPVQRGKEENEGVGVEESVREVGVGKFIRGMFSESLVELRSVLSDESLQQFSPMGGSLREDILNMMDRVEADQEWSKYSDPNLEEKFVGVVTEFVNNPLQMSNIVGARMVDNEWQQASFDRVGGDGTLGRVWRRLKELELVVGVKRLRDTGSDISSEEIISLGSSISMNRKMEYTLADMDDLITTIDSHRSSVISGLRMRLLELGIESGSDNPYESDSTESSQDTDDSDRDTVDGAVLEMGSLVVRAQLFRDDLVVVYERDEEDTASRGIFSAEE